MLDLAKVHKRFTDLEDGRQPIEAVWREVAKYYLPTSMQWSRTGMSSFATKRGAQVYDDTPAWAAGRFAAAMLGMIMNPAQKWLEFEMHTGSDDLSLEAKQWLAILRDKVLFVLQAPEVGFYDAMHEHLLDYGIFGEACMLIDRDPSTKMVRFTPYPLEQCFIGMGSSRKPDTVFRRYEMSTQAIIDVFGDDNLPEEVFGAKQAGDWGRKFVVIHGVFPRKHGIAKGFDFNKPWASVYYLESSKKLLKESGFDYFPFSCPRFMLFASEEHGQGPGTTSLANVRALNTIIKTLLVSDQRKAAPSYVAQRRGWIKGLTLNIPDHVNYYDGFDMEKSIMPIGNDGQPQAGMEFVERYTNQILKAFYLDRLHGSDKRAEMKEVEVLVNEDERMRDMVPQLSRLHAESISNVVLNVTDYVMDEMPEFPPELEGQGIKIRYLSPLARAQRLLEVSNANRTMQQVILPYSQIDPAALKSVNTHKFITWSLENSGFPAEVRVSEEEYQASLEAEQQQAQAAQMLEAGQGAAQIAKDVSTAQKNTPSALSGFF